MKKIMMIFVAVFLACGFLVSAQAVVGNPFATGSFGGNGTVTVQEPKPSVQVQVQAQTQGKKSEAVAVPLVVEYLMVPKELEGAVIHGSYDDWKLSKTVGPEGKTEVILKEGWFYLLEKDKKFFYPNGDACVAWWSIAKYLGGGRWLNTYDLSTKEKQPIEAKDFKPYEVKWPK